MLYLRSFNRFILISLALLGLSVSSANAKLTSGNDISFGRDSITIDSVSGLEWLDLTHTLLTTFNYVSGQFGAGKEYDGWRHATEDEVDAFWSSGGSTGTAGPWVADVIDLWGFTVCYVNCTNEYARFITGEPAGAGSHWGGSLAGIALMQGHGTRYEAHASMWPVIDTAGLDDLGHALVRDPNAVSVVPVPAAIWLFGTALIGLVGYGKRKSKVPV